MTEVRRASFEGSALVRSQINSVKCSTIGSWKLEYIITGIYTWSNVDTYIVFVVDEFLDEMLDFFLIVVQNMTTEFPHQRDGAATHGPFGAAFSAFFLRSGGDVKLLQNAVHRRTVLLTPHFFHPRKNESSQLQKRETMK